MREQLCKKHHESIYSIMHLKLSDFWPIVCEAWELCWFSGWFAAKPAMRVLNSTCEQFGFAMLSAACQRTATWSQKPHTKSRQQTKDVKAGWGWLGIIGDGSGVMLACWLLWYLLIRCSMFVLCFVGVRMCVCDREKFDVSLPCLQTLYESFDASYSCFQLPSPSYQCSITLICVRPNIYACRLVHQ